MKTLPSVLLILAMLGTGCTLAAAETVEVTAKTDMVTMPDITGMDAVAAIKTLRSADLGARITESDEGTEREVILQLPKAGEELLPGTTVDIAVSGDKITIERIYKELEPDFESEKGVHGTNIDAVREGLKDEYVLDESQLADFAPRPIEGLPDIVDRDRYTPKMEKSSEGTTDNETRSAKPEGGKENKVAEQDSDKESEPVSKAGDKNGPLQIDSSQMTGPNSVNVGVWHVAMPGATAPVSTVVQGFQATGFAAKTADDRTVVVLSSDVVGQDGKPLAAGVVDQLLIGSTHRFGEPTRSGRTEVAGMPAVASVIQTASGPAKAVTWYGYGQLSDVIVPLDAEGHADSVLQGILDSISI